MDYLAAQMRRAVALLAAALLLAGAAGCGGGGAEPGAPRGASLILDFTPNAVHSGIYAARARGLLRRRRGRPHDPPARRIDRRAEAARRRPHRLRDRRHPRPRHRPRARPPPGRADADRAAAAGGDPRPPRRRRPLAARPRGAQRRRHRPALGRSRGRIRGRRRRRRPGEGERGDDRVQRGLLPGRGQDRRRDRVLERRGRRAAPARGADPDLQGRPLRRSPLPRAGAGDLRADARIRARAGRSDGRRHPPRLRLRRRPPAAGARRPPRRRTRPWNAPTRPPSSAPSSPSCSPSPFKPRVLEAWAAWDLEHGLLEHKLDVETARDFDLAVSVRAGARPSPAVRATCASEARRGRPPPPRPPRRVSASTCE